MKVNKSTFPFGILLQVNVFMASTSAILEDRIFASEFRNFLYPANGSHVLDTAKLDIMLVIDPTEVKPTLPSNVEISGIYLHGRAKDARAALTLGVQNGATDAPTEQESPPLVTVSLQEAIHAELTIKLGCRSCDQLGIELGRESRDVRLYLDVTDAAQSTHDIAICVTATKTEVEISVRAADPFLAAAIQQSIERMEPGIAA